MKLSLITATKYCMGFVCIFLASCTQPNSSGTDNTTATTNNTPGISGPDKDGIRKVTPDYSTIFSSPESMESYLNSTIRINQTSILLKQDSVRVGPRDFLRLLYNGKYFPFHTITKQDTPVYKLRNHDLTEAQKKVVANFAVDKNNELMAMEAQ